MSKIVITIPGMYFGGMERVAFIARELLLGSGYDVELVTLFRGDPDYIPGFDYTCLECEVSPTKLGKVFTTLKRIRRLKQYKKFVKPDYVLTFGKSPSFCNVWSRCDEKIIVGIRSYDWLYSFYYGFHLEKLMYKKADKVVSVSKLIQLDAEKIFSIPSEKSTYLYNPYDLQVICNKAREKITEFDIPTDKKIVVSVGRLENQKGFYHLIKAISLLDSKKDIKVYILGHGSKKDNLQELIKALGLEDIIILAGGQANPYKFMKKADIYVMPSITEGFPNALVEAMAVGTPVLSADCKSGPREILTEDDLYKCTKGVEYGKYGILVEAMTDSRNYDYKCIEKCDEILAEALQELLTNSEILREYGERAQERAAMFSYDMFKERLLELL